MKFLERVGWVSIATAFLIFPSGWYIEDFAWGLYGWCMFTIQGLLWLLSDTLMSRE